MAKPKRNVGREILEDHSFPAARSRSGKNDASDHLRIIGAELLRLAEGERATGLGGVPAMAREVLDYPELREFDLAAVRSFPLGGAPVRSEIVTTNASRRWNAPNGRGASTATAVSAATAANSTPVAKAAAPSRATAAPAAASPLAPRGQRRWRTDRWSGPR